MRHIELGTRQVLGPWEAVDSETNRQERVHAWNGRSSSSAANAGSQEQAGV